MYSWKQCSVSEFILNISSRIHRMCAENGKFSLMFECDMYGNTFVLIASFHTADRPWLIVNRLKSFLVNFPQPLL